MIRRHPAADLGDDLFVGFGGTVDGDLGVSLVEGVSFFEEVGDGFAGGHDDAAGVEVGEAAFEEVGGEVQVDDEAGGGEVLHGGSAVDDASAGGDDVGGEVEGEDEALLDGEEGVDAAGVDDVLEGASFAGLDGDVGVEEVAGGGLGEEDADGGLADAGHADEDEIRARGHGFCCHGVAS